MSKVNHPTDNSDDGNNNNTHNNSNNTLIVIQAGWAGFIIMFNVR